MFGIGAARHPGLEAVFNLVLCWAALMAGFIVDGKKANKEGNAMLNSLLGGQFLTNAIFLPYLATRPPGGYAASSKSGGLGDVYREDLDVVEAVGESKALPIVLGAVSLYAIAWGLFARPEFGDVPTRAGSLWALVTSDRLSFSFVVDLVYFGLWQKWLVHDDSSRRVWPRGDESKRRAEAAANVPFFGLLFYFFTRPTLPSRAEMDERKQL